MKSALRLSVFGIIIASIATLTAAAQTATPLSTKPCQNVNQSITATDYAKLSLVNDNFKVGDLVFIPGIQTTSAVKAAQARYNKLGITWDTLCNGSVTIFVNNPNYSWDQIEAVYNKLSGFLIVQAGLTAMRPVDKEDLL